jgi:hypothetical protein
MSEVVASVAIRHDTRRVARPTKACARNGCAEEDRRRMTPGGRVGALFLKANSGTDQRNV